MTNFCVVSADEKRHSSEVNGREEIYESMTEENIIEALHGHDKHHELVYEYLAEYATGHINQEKLVEALDSFIAEARNEWVGGKL